MEPFVYRDGSLFVENVPLADIARDHGTPTYVYSRSAIEAQWRAYDSAFGDVPHLVCFAVKSNSNLAVLGVLALRDGDRKAAVEHMRTASASVIGGPTSALVQHSAHRRTLSGLSSLEAAAAASFDSAAFDASSLRQQHLRSPPAG